MDLAESLFSDHLTLDEEDAHRLQNGVDSQYSVEVHPPRKQDIPATLNRFTKGITEHQTKWLGLINTSPITSYEIRRSKTGKITFQYSTPTKRLNRKIRTQLTEDIPEIGFSPGTNGIPVSPGTTIGGGLLTVGRKDWYPLRTEFDTAPINNLAITLHRHAMKDTQLIIQILFQPVIGAPVRNRWWIHRGYQRIGYLRKQKTGALPWHDRPATPREKRQADKIEEKAGNPRFHVTIRFLVIGAAEHTPSRVKELAGAFNVFEDDTTGQYLNTETIQTIRKKQFLDYADTVRKREFGDWSLRFQASHKEVAALISVPDRHQENIRYSQP